MGTVARQNVSFRCTSVDRIGIRGYVPGLQYEGGVVRFLLERGNHIPSPAALNRNHERMVAELDAFVEASGVPLVRFDPRGRHLIHVVPSTVPVRLCPDDGPRHGAGGCRPGPRRPMRWRSSERDDAGALRPEITGPQAQRADDDRVDG